MTGSSTGLTLATPTFDEEKLLIYRELYYSGFSSIVAARDLATGGSVVLKKVDFANLLALGMSRGQIIRLQRAYLKKLRQQMSRLRKLNHISLGRVTECIREPRRVIVMSEMCQSGDLFNWILLQSSIRFRDVCFVLHYLFQALAYLHSQGLVHGALMPTHVLFHSSSPQSVVLSPDLSLKNELTLVVGQHCGILDGYAPELVELALEWEDKQAMTRRLHADVDGDFLQSASSPSPSPLASTSTSTSQLADELQQEMAHLEAAMLRRTPQMDVWAVGVIGVIALTGLAPFRGTSLAEMRRALHTHGTLHALRHPLLVCLGGEFLGHLARLFQLDPDERASAAEAAGLAWHETKSVVRDSRNLLYITEYSLMSTCRRYRLHGQEVAAGLTEAGRQRRSTDNV